MSSEQPFPPAMQFVQLLWRLDHALNQRSRAMLRVLGVTSPQRFILRMLRLRPGCSPSDLARALHVTAPTVTRVLQRMERAGLVRRDIDGEDSRRVRLHLTAAGSRVDERADESGESPILDVVNATPPHLLDATAEVLSSLIRSLERPTRARTRARRARRGRQ